MKTVQRLLLGVALVAIVLSLATPGYAQVTLSSTTLAAAVTSTSTTYIQVTSATGFTARQTYAFVDREYLQVISVNGTTIQVARGFAGTLATTHATAKTIYVGPAEYFSSFDRAGSCTSTQELVLPVINIKTGTIFNCVSSLWTITNGPGTQGTGLTSLGPNAAGTVDVGSTSLAFRDIFLAGSSGTPATNRYKITGASTSGLRTITLPDASVTLPGTVHTDCGVANACSAAAKSTITKIVTGTTAALDGGSPATAAVTGMPAFTGTTTYHCTANVIAAAASTHVLATTNVSSSAFTIYAANGSTELVQWVCVGW